MTFFNEISHVLYLHFEQFSDQYKQNTRLHKRGRIWFDGLAAHLVQHNAPSIISVGEDATRVISRVEYDCETDRCVGFVLPLNKCTGLPEIDSFLAVSFKAIEEMFSKNQIAKYAYVYMATPLAVDAPSFY